MAETETYWNPNTKRTETREKKSAADVDAAETKARLQAPLGAKKTGKGMLPGETIDQYKKRRAAEAQGLTSDDAASALSK